MLLSYTQLVEVVEAGYLQNVNPENINGSSIDIVLGPKLLIERVPSKGICPICKGDIQYPREARESLRFGRETEVTCPHRDCGSTSEIRQTLAAIDLSAKQPLEMEEVDCTDGFVLNPGEVCLAHSVEVFNLPRWLTAEYRLKSSQARCFLEHLHAGWCDPGWTGSKLTLEFVNLTKYHPLTLRAGMKIGQVTFTRHEEVPLERSYTVRGQYNNLQSVAQSGGIK